MQGVGPGTLLGGRYALRHRLSAGSHLERWSGHDATLEREVSLTIVGSEHPNRAGVLDAARRAAGVEDARLVRILDVGTQSGNSFIVEEAMSRSESLATILLQGPLSAEEARRVAGETARGLETAGQRGLHHLRLTPHHVLIAADGALRISGVAVAAAIDEPDRQEPDTAISLRRDAISLAAILYAALTGRWPLDEEVPGVEPAPRTISGVVAPAEIATGVPDDLDALCQKMLNESIGPLTPGVFANRIAPWPRDRVQPVVDPTLTLHLPGSDHASEVPASEVETEPTVATSTHPESADAASARDRASSPAETAPQPNTPAPVTAHTAEDRAAAAGAAATKASGTAPTDAGAVAGASAVAGAGAVAGASAVAGAGAVGGRPTSSFARVPAEGGARPDHNTERMRLPEGLLNQYDDDGPPLPMLPASTALPPSKGQTKIVILVVATFVGLSLLVGYRGLADLGSDTSTSKPTARRTVTVIAPPVTVPASPAPKTAAGAGSIAILSATGFDPQGDKHENNSAAARVYDENLATSWTSEGYNTPELGNLKKGAGVVLDLGQPTSVHQVTIDLGSGPTDLTVYAATSPSLNGATVIGSASAASGQSKLKAATTMPESQYVIVWFTRLPPEGSQFRASISEIALS